MSKTVVIVVHGVGDPKAGDALESLVQGLVGTTRLRETAPRTIEQRVEPGDAEAGSPLVQCWPVTGATMRAEASPHDELRLHEVYWGDLARVKGSALGLLYALVDFIFGLKHIVTAACAAALMDPRLNGAPRTLVRIGNVLATCALWLVRGPLFALNLLAAAVGLSIRYVVLLGVSERAAAVFGSLALALVALLINEPLRRRRWSVTTARWMLVVGLCAAAAWFFVPRDEIHRSSGSWWWWPADPIGNTWAIEAITTAISLVALPTAVAGLAMTAAHGVAWALQVFRAPAWDLGRSLIMVNFCTGLGVGLFTFVVMLAWTAVSKAVGGDERIERGLHLFGLVWLAFLAVVVAYVVVMAANAWRARDGRRREPLRYVVSPLVVIGFCAATIVYGLLVVPMVLHLERGLLRPASGWPAPVWQWACSVYRLIERFDEWMRPAAFGLSAALLALLASTRAHALTALDLVLDVVAHFKTAPLRMACEGVGRQRAGESRGAAERWLWESTVERFQDVVTSAVDANTTRVIVVSHSQGTTVALAGLGILQVHGARPRSAPKALDGVADVRVVTMGSPIDHLYRHYMRPLYETDHALKKRFPWLNVYRQDDFIGTRVGDDQAWPKNVRVGPRSHTNYWRDREVLREVLPWLDMT